VSAERLPPELSLAALAASEWVCPPHADKYAATNAALGSWHNVPQSFM
jgi:hypothetical protein